MFGGSGVDFWTGHRLLHILDPTGARGTEFEPVFGPRLFAKSKKSKNPTLQNKAFPRYGFLSHATDGPAPSRRRRREQTHLGRFGNAFGVCSQFRGNKRLILTNGLKLLAGNGSNPPASDSIRIWVATDTKQKKQKITKMSERTALYITYLWGT